MTPPASRIKAGLCSLAFSASILRPQPAFLPYTLTVLQVDPLPKPKCLTPYPYNMPEALSPLLLCSDHSGAEVTLYFSLPI